MMEEAKKQSVAGILMYDSLVFIGKRIPQGTMGGKWEFPGGKVEKGETCREALVREFQEEFETDIEVGEQIAQAEFVHNKEPVGLFAYRVYLKSDDIHWVLSEHTDVKWVSLDEISSLDFVDSDLLLVEQIKKNIKQL